jgi:hypothetical protein
MPLPFFLGALFGKAAAGAVSKAIGSKAVVASGKTGHHSLVRKLFGKAAEKAVDGCRSCPHPRREKEGAAPVIPAGPFASRSRLLLRRLRSPLRPALSQLVRGEARRKAHPHAGRVL